MTNMDKLSELIEGVRKVDAEIIASYMETRTGRAISGSLIHATRVHEREMIALAMIDDLDAYILEYTNADRD